MTAGEGWEIARVLEKAAEAEDKKGIAKKIMKQQGNVMLLSISLQHSHARACWE